MSERMIEIQRAKMGLPPISRPVMMPQSGGATSGVASAGGAAGTANPLASTPNSTHASAGGSRNVSLTPQQQAVASVMSQDERLHRFLLLIQKRNPTVPTTLSRRMLQREGVGFLDDLVPSVLSAAADRFLATVLQQASTCRERRIQGMELIAEEDENRRQYRKKRKASSDNRERRKRIRLEKQKKGYETAIAAEKAMASGAKNASKPSSSKKKKSGSKANTPALTSKEAHDKETALSSEGSEDEDFYYGDFEDDTESKEGDEELNQEEDDEDENRFALLLRDLVQPLEAYGVTMVGKLGLGTFPKEEVEDTLMDENEKRLQEETAANGDNRGDNDKGDKIDETFGEENGGIPANESEEKEEKAAVSSSPGAITSKAK